MASNTPAETVRGTACGVAAAVLFGASAPLSKLLLPDVGVLTLAGLFYLAGGLALGAVALATPGRAARGREARLRLGDLPMLAVVVLLGGVAGPILLLEGLTRVSGVTGALLLNLEAPFTILLALLLFGEHLGRRDALGATLIVAAAAALGARSAAGLGGGDWVGAAAIAGACLSWAIDNNLTQRLSVRDPLAVARVKTLGAGVAMLAVAAATGAELPRAGLLLPALAVGAASYGASMLLFVYALRALGAARQAAWFATAPFAGALLAIPLLGERPTTIDAVAAAVMVAGVVLLARAAHVHAHTHATIEHDHAHVHDEHHRHDHDGSSPLGEPHAHPHAHDPITHAHPHVSDSHHRHRH